MAIVSHRLSQAKFHLSSCVFESSREDKVGDGMSYSHIVSKE
jgi:hypothetical protein